MWFWLLSEVDVDGTSGGVQAAAIVSAVAAVFTAVALVIAALAGLVRSLRVEGKMDLVASRVEAVRETSSARYVEDAAYQRQLLLSLLNATPPPVVEPAPPASPATGGAARS